jgi:hypothetical protein
MHILVYCAVLKHLATPSDFHISWPSIVPLANSETSSTHCCMYPIFPGSSVTTSVFPYFRFPVDHNFWQSHWAHSHMPVPNYLFSGYVIQYRPKFAGSNPAETVGFFGRKNPHIPFFGGKVKPSVPCRRFAACTRTL